MKNEAGAGEKIIAAAPDKALYRKIQNYSDLPEMLLTRIAHFYEHCNGLESAKWIKVNRWAEEAEAQAHTMI